jgi:hypothetical protein
MNGQKNTHREEKILKDRSLKHIMLLPSFVRVLCRVIIKIISSLQLTSSQGEQNVNVKAWME